MGRNKEGGGKKREDRIREGEKKGREPEEIERMEKKRGRTRG